MIESLLLIAIAFTVGYLTRPRLSQFWYWNRPVRCPQCGKWVTYKRTVSVQHRVAGFTNICDTCYRALYRPSEKAK